MTRKWLYGVLLLLIAGSATSAECVVSWTNATRNTDDSFIPASGAGSLVRTTVEYGSCDAQGGFDQKVDEIFVPAPNETLILNPVVQQMYCLRAFHSNTFATSFVALEPGNSDFSNVAECDLPLPAPLPPSNLSVVGPDLTAYIIVQTPDNVTALAIGTVPQGTECDPTDTFNGYYKVPTASVQWFNPSTTGLVTFAACGG